MDVVIRCTIPQTVLYCSPKMRECVSFFFDLGESIYRIDDEPFVVETASCLFSHDIFCFSVVETDGIPLRIFRISASTCRTLMGGVDIL